VAFPGENLAGLQNSFCSFAISFALLSNSARSFGFYFFFPCNCLLPAFFWVSLIFMYFPCYFCCLNMPQYLAWQRLWQRQQPPRDPNGPCFFPVFPARFNRLFQLPIFHLLFTFARPLFSAGPTHFLYRYLSPAPFLKHSPEYVCVCFPVCLRLSLAFMELIKTSLCSFGKTEK